MLQKICFELAVNRSVKVIITFLAIVFFIQSENANAQNPTVSFTVVGANSGCAPFNTQFVNNSSNASSYLWDFGNGNTSTLANPTIVYTIPGNYTVKLVAIGASGNRDSLIKNNFITVIQKPVADFIANTTSTCAENQISFTNLSQNADSCLWDFGDGITSNGLNPVHTYNASGQFSVTLISYNRTFGCSDAKTKTQYITIHPKPVSNFSSSVTTTCDISHVFSFISGSSNANAWTWNFGDGTFSNIQNPNHSYSAPGVSSISLITANSFGCLDTLTITDYITVLNNPKPPISVSDSSGCTPFGVYLFTNNGALSYAWNFGDSTFSSLQNPSHTYIIGGNPIVNLTVSYQNGCSNSSSFSELQLSATTQGSYFHSNSSGCIPLNVQFTNTTQGSGNNYLWNFGDGLTSTQVSPTHVYTTAGVYQVILTTTNAAGCTHENISTTVYATQPNASFNADVTSGCPPLSVKFTSLSTATGQQYYWNFGDGTTSNQMHPQHTFINTGNYVVSLRITDVAGCSSTYILPDSISVNNQQSQFIPPSPVAACAPFNINFSDSSSGATSWLWDFGDGNMSSLQNPSHTYTTPGTYNVALGTQTTGSGCDQYIPVYSTYIIQGGSANFSFITELCPPYTAYFTDSSVNAVSWLWNFGDATTSTLQNPVHIYASPGTYTVSLTITTANGCAYTTTHNYAITFSPLITSPAAFSTDSVLPLNVQFSANSQGATQWLWNFGDGGTSNLEDPTHIFSNGPPYNISLTISNDSCSVTMNFPNVTLGAGGTPFTNDTVIIHEPEPQRGCVPLIVHFHNPVLHAVSWFWDFGDGTTSTLENPVHTYSNTGLYTLKLVTHNQSGVADTMIKPSSILVSGADANFSISHSNSCQGNSVTLISSSNNAASYQWNFGDGNTSTLSNPTHVYTNINSNYVISLSVTDSTGCSDFLTKSFYGAVNNAVSADKNRICLYDTINFKSNNLSFASYQWNFGDGTNSNSLSPFHVYQSTGVFNVTLSVTDSVGCVQVLNLPYTIQVSNPVANFVLSDSLSICWGVRYWFSNLSQNATNWLWNFGDGFTSIEQNPEHFYSASGFHTVTLTVDQNNCRSMFALPNAVYIPDPSAEFSFVKNSNCLPLNVNFADSSIDAVSWMWDFGDGTISTIKNPNHVYTTKPTSDVALTIKDIYGCEATITKKVIEQLTIAASPLSTVAGCNPLEVSFTDSSENAVSWLWNFGDGTSSNDINPSHIYQQNGFYTVQLIVSSSSGCNDTLALDSIIHVAGPIANFASNIQNGCSPAIVDFTNSSLNTETWSWDFGDSSYSASSNPSHIYNRPGSYAVVLVVSDSVGCSDTLQMQSMINVRGTVASFTGSDNNGCAPYAVPFTNNSLNASDWFWSFGDGDSSAVLHPVHNYTNPGNYVASLITHDSTGCESIFTDPDTIHVYKMPGSLFSISDSTGCAPMNISFNNLSTDGNSYLWNFDDGSTSSAVTPSHNYVTPGSYHVSLVVTAQGGCSDTLNYSNPINIFGTPVADFSANITEGCAPLALNFTNQSSGIQNETYLWNFGNGYTSTLPNPVAAYFVAGTYNVTLTVFNGGLCSTAITKTAYIKVYETTPPEIANILNVTVVSNTSVDINWANVADADLYEYKLFRLNKNTGAYENIYSLIDTNSTGLNVSTNYRDNGLNTLQNSYTYKVQTIDRCGNRIDISGLNPHTTINVTAVAQNKNVTVSWTAYEGCSVSEYRIYRADANNIFKLVAAVPSSVNSYLDTTVTCPIGYAYKIKAMDLCGSPYYSLSDTAIAIPASDLGNQFVDVVFSSVVDNKNILTEWSPTELAPDKVVQYDVYRSTDKINYEIAGSVDADELKFTDTNVDVEHQNYYYTVRIINECDVATLESSIGSSVLLTSDYNETDESVKLRWTKYEGWNTGVDKYVIERKKANGIWETFKIVDGNTFESEDR